ncbi:MAG: efflux RND transporter periplasmic adaptor subunit [Prevotellaceae bacterium]|jgi:RND family efflux transporter MFP subunit|nr:efflux RND transporter periplasmic adaptor subunit [Prevotellaceae bacterium]
MKIYLKFSFLTMLMVGIFACSNKKTTEIQSKIIPVKVMKIAAMQTASVKNYVGTVEESAAVSLSFSLMGTVEEVFVQEGQRVQKGRLLATLNSATAENSYQASLAKLHQAQDAYDRLAKVHENGSLPDIKFVEVETGLQQAKSMAAVTKKNLDDCNLYAPRNGVIAKREIESGMNVMPSMQAFKLVTVETVLVKISVPENEIGGIVEGQRAEIEVPALNNKHFSGKVELKGIAAAPVSHTYEAKIGVANPQSLLMPGMVCRVETRRAVSLQTGNLQPAEIVVPNRCIQISADGRKYVWLADGNIAKRQFVKTGDLTNSGIVIAEGLSAGDTIITEGFLQISEGTKIAVNE